MLATDAGFAFNLNSNLASSISRHLRASVRERQPFKWPLNVNCIKYICSPAVVVVDSCCCCWRESRSTRPPPSIASRDDHLHLAAAEATAKCKSYSRLISPLTPTLGVGGGGACRKQDAKNRQQQRARTTTDKSGQCK